MDSIEATYMSMFDKSPEKQEIQLSDVDNLRNEILYHIDQIIYHLEEPIKSQLYNFIKILQIQGYDISNYLSIPCIDELTGQFVLQTKNRNIQMFIIPNQVSTDLIRKGNPTFQFCSGPKSSPTGSIINVYFKKPVFNKKYLKQAKKLKEEKQNTFTKPREESIQNIWTQYVGYFRSKNQ